MTNFQTQKRAVITGAGVVSPLGMGWQNWTQGLRDGVPGIRRLTHFDPLCPISVYGVRHETPVRAHAPISCHVAGEVPDFTPSDWMNPKDLPRVPRIVPLALCAAREALQSAGLDELDESAKREVDVIIGSGGGGFSFAEEQFARWYGNGHEPFSPYVISSAIAGMVSSEISIAHGFRGRSHTISNGCTSSSDALGNALDLIRNGRVHTVLCGGADAPITPGIMAGFCLMRAVPTKYNDTPEMASRPFDRDRDGFVLGEGAWMFIVEERERALARGAKIWAEISGYGATCEAYHRVMLGSPDEAARAMQMALDDAQIEAGQIDYVNLHGTATPLNDPLETAAVKIALGQRAAQIPLSSTKSQIGHPQGASGAAGVAATLAGMHKGFAPPTINLENPDAACDLDYVANHSRPASIQMALCNCLGFGSKNSALLIKRDV
jgi:3-oxoacyl-[acyl-carrier-protein] synthase II